MSGKDEECPWEEGEWKRLRKGDRIAYRPIICAQKRGIARELRQERKTGKVCGRKGRGKRVRKGGGRGAGVVWLWVGGCEYY